MSHTTNHWSSSVILAEHRDVSCASCDPVMPSISGSSFGVHFISRRCMSRVSSSLNNLPQRAQWMGRRWHLRRCCLTSLIRFSSYLKHWLYRAGSFLPKGQAKVRFAPLSLRLDEDGLDFLGGGFFPLPKSFPSSSSLLPRPLSSRFLLPPDDWFSCLALLVEPPELLPALDTAPD